MTAITNYGTLKTAIAEKMARSDLTSLIPDFVRFAESRIRTDVRTNDQETTGTLVISSEDTALPTGFLELRRINVDGTPRISLEYYTPQQLSDLNIAETNKPRKYTITGNNIRVYPVPDGNYTLNLTYIKAYDAFSSDTDTNNLLTNYPNIYLYASLLEGFIYTRNQAETDKYSSLYVQAVERLRDLEKRMLYPSTGLRTRQARRNP